MPLNHEVPLLQVENLKKYYSAKSGMFSRSSGEIRAVDGVSFSLYKGETLGLVGESGCGKSTLGRQIVGLERPTGGPVSGKGSGQYKRRPDAVHTHTAADGVPGLLLIPEPQEAYI